MGEDQFHAALLGGQPHRLLSIVADSSDVARVKGGAVFDERSKQVIKSTTRSSMG
jgi:hypothetical protein